MALGNGEKVQGDVTNIVRAIDTSIQSGIQKFSASFSTGIGQVLQKLEQVKSSIGGVTVAFDNVFARSLPHLLQAANAMQQISQHAKSAGQNIQSIDAARLNAILGNMPATGGRREFYGTGGDLTSMVREYAYGARRASVREDAKGNIKGVTLTEARTAQFDRAREEINNYIQAQQGQLLESRSTAGITSGATSRMREVYQLIDGRIATYTEDQAKAIATLNIRNAPKPKATASGVLSPERALAAELGRAAEAASSSHVAAEQQAKYESMGASMRERAFAHANRFAAMGQAEPGFLDHLKSNFSALKDGIGQVSGAVGTVISKMRALGRMSIYFSAMIYSAENLGRILRTAIVAPMEAIASATAKSRLFELSISGVTGSANARAIDTAIGRNLNSTPFSLADTRQMVTDLTHIGPIAQQLATSSPAQAQSLIGGYQRTIAGLQAMNPQSTTADIIRGIQESLLGQGRGLRTVVQIDPDQLAQMVGRGRQAAFRGNPQLLMTALGDYVSAFGPANGANGLINTPEVQIQHIKDQFSLALQQIGDSGVFDHIVAKLRSFSDQLSAYFDPSNAQWSLQMQAIGKTVTEVFDGMTSAGAALVQELAGADAPARSIGDLVVQLEALGRAAAWAAKNIVVPVASGIGEYAHAMTVGVTDSAPNFWDNLKWIAKGYSATGPYSRSVLPYYAIHSMRPQLPSNGPGGIDSNTPEGIRNLLMFNYGGASALSGGFASGKDETVANMRDAAVAHLKYLDSGGWLKAKKDAHGDPMGALYDAFPALLREKIAEEGLMEARVKGEGQADRYHALIFGQTPLAAQAAKLGVTGLSGIGNLPSDVQKTALSEGLASEIGKLGRAGGLNGQTGSLIGQTDILHGNLLLYQQYGAKSRSLGLSGIADTDYALQLQAQNDLTAHNAKMIQQYGGLIMPGMSPDQIASQAMLPQSSLFGPSRTSNQISMYSSALAQAKGQLAQLYAQTNNMANADKGQIAAFGQLSGAVALYSSKIAELGQKNNEVAETFTKLGDSAEKTLANGIGKYLTDIELHAKNASQALRQLGQSLLNEFNGGMSNLIMQAGFSGLSSMLNMDDTSTGAKTGLGQILGGLAGPATQAALSAFGVHGASYPPPAGSVPILSPISGSGSVWSALPAWSPGMPMTVTPNADGGIYNSPHMGLIGERGPEAVVPLDRSFISVGYDGSHAILPGGGRIPVVAHADGGVFGAMGLHVSGAGSVSGFGPNTGGAAGRPEVRIYNVASPEEASLRGYSAIKEHILNDVYKEAKPGGKLHRAAAHR